MTRRSRCHGDDGSGLIGLIGSVIVFLVLMLFAVQLLMNLYATSVVTSAAYEGARQVAGARIDHGNPDEVDEARSSAEDRVRSLLGGVGDTATLDWNQSSDDSVALRIQVQPPRFGWPGMSARSGFGRIDRTVRVRVEQWQ